MKFFRYLIAFAVGNLLLGLSLPATAQLDSREQWEAAFSARYSEGEPLLDITNGNDDGLFAWHGHYWLRAYVAMATTFGDTLYLRRAFRLIDHMLAYRDDARAERGELDLEQQPYFSAPLPYLTARGRPAPGWRRLAFGTEWRVQTLDDGQITSAIMRVVEAVLSRPDFAAFASRARDYLEHVQQTVEAHESLFVIERFANVPGSYYYPNPDGSGLYSGAVPFNHSATMGVTLLLLDRVTGESRHRRKAEALVDYFLQHVRLRANDAYEWDYHLHNPTVLSDADTSIEDFNHAHIDLGFLALAYEAGIRLQEADMLRLTRTLTHSVYRGEGELAWSVDGSATDAQKRYWSVAFGWIELAAFDLQVLAIAREVYDRHYRHPGWAQPFLGWAELLRWTAKPPDSAPPDSTAPAPPAKLRVKRQQ